MRSLAAWLSAFHEQNLHPSFAQGDRKRQSNDAATDDDDVPGLHSRIVEEAIEEKQSGRTETEADPGIVNKCKHLSTTA